MITLKFEQDFTRPVREIWDFISSPANLNRVTPENLNFRTLTHVPESMYPGLIIGYEVKLPFIGRTKWLTEIKYIEENVRFVDEQRIGPYKFWWHEHTLTEIGEGRTRMTDQVTLAVGYGPIGAIAEKILIEREVKKIFAFRHQTLSQIFPEPEH